MEGRPGLTYANLSKILRAHFHEKDATSLFTLLGTAKQNSSESAQEFVMRLMTLRQKILFVSREDPIPYDKPLVQRRFQQAVYTGLKNDNIRIQLRDLLKTNNTSDEDILERLTLAVTDESEHREKFQLNKKPSVSSVNVAAATNDQGKELRKPNPILDQISELRAEIKQLSVQQHANKKDGTQNASVRANNQSINSRSKNHSPNPQIRKCKQCQKNNEPWCDHCYSCGASNHFYAGCRYRNNGKN